MEEMRAVLKTQLTIGLLSFGVKLYTMWRDTASPFCLLSPCHSSPVRSVYLCQTCGAEVDRRTAKRGYKGTELVFEPEELEALDAGASAMETLGFVDLGTIDPLLLENSYWLGPEEKSEHPYSLLLRALDITGTGVLVRVVLHQKERYGVIRAYRNRLALCLLRFPSHQKPAPEVELPPVGERELELAGKLAEAYRAEFDPSKITDRTEEIIRKLIEAKTMGQPLPAPAPERKEKDMAELLEATIQQLRKKAPAFWR